MILRSLLRRKDGAVALEMALVSPLLLLLFFGIYDFGTLFVEAMQVEHATQAGATFAANEFSQYGSTSLSDIQAAATASSPIAVTVAADPSRPSTPWCGCPDATGTAVETVACDGTCTAGVGTYFSIVGSAPTHSKLGPWLGFPSTLSTKVLIRLF